jgi:hypothetical protein
LLQIKTAKFLTVEGTDTVVEYVAQEVVALKFAGVFRLAHDVP